MSGRLSLVGTHFVVAVVVVAVSGAVGLAGVGALTGLEEKVPDCAYLTHIGT